MFGLELLQDLKLLLLIADWSAMLAEAAVAILVLHYLEVASLTLVCFAGSILLVGTLLHPREAVSHLLCRLSWVSALAM